MGVAIKFYSTRKRANGCRGISFDYGEANGVGKSSQSSRLVFSYLFDFFFFLSSTKAVVLAIRYYCSYNNNRTVFVGGFYFIPRKTFRGKKIWISWKLNALISFQKSGEGFCDCFSDWKPIPRAIRLLEILHLRQFIPGFLFLMSTIFGPQNMKHTLSSLWWILFKIAQRTNVDKMLLHGLFLIIIIPVGINNSLRDEHFGTSYTQWPLILSIQTKSYNLP